MQLRSTDWLLSLEARAMALTSVVMLEDTGDRIDSGTFILEATAA